MKYNKCALVLIFFASSAFASLNIATFLEGLSKATNKKEYYENNAPFLPKTEIESLISKNNSDYTIKSLTKYYYEDASEKVFSAIDDIKDCNESDYDKYKLLMSELQFKNLKSYLKIAKKSLTKDEIKKFLKDEDLPKIPAEERANDILNLCGSKFINETPNIIELSSPEHSKLMILEEKRSSRKLNHQEITKILNLDISVINDRILDLTAQNIKDILVKSNKSFNEIDPEIFDDFNLNPDILLTLIHKNPTSAVNSDEIKVYLKTPRHYNRNDSEFAHVMTIYILKFVARDLDRVGNLSNLEDFVGTGGMSKVEKEGKAEAIKFQEKKANLKISEDVLRKILAANSDELAPFLVDNDSLPTPHPGPTPSRPGPCPKPSNNKNKSTASVKTSNQLDPVILTEGTNFYTTRWFILIVIFAVLILAAIGGGAYILTRKSRTDL